MRSELALESDITQRLLQQQQQTRSRGASIPDAVDTSRLMQVPSKEDKARNIAAKASTTQQELFNVNNIASLNELRTISNQLSQKKLSI